MAPSIKRIFHVICWSPCLLRAACTPRQAHTTAHTYTLHTHTHTHKQQHKTQIACASQPGARLLGTVCLKACVCWLQIRDYLVPYVHACLLAVPAGVGHAALLDPEHGLLKAADSNKAWRQHLKELAGGLTIGVLSGADTQQAAPQLALLLLPGWAYG